MRFESTAKVLANCKLQYYRTSECNMASAGMSLVPVADIFNHKAAVVELSSDYAIEPVCFGDGDDSSDSEGGSTNSQSPAADNDGSGAEEANSGELSSALDHWTGGFMAAASKGQPAQLMYCSKTIIQVSNSMGMRSGDLGAGLNKDHDQSLVACTEGSLQGQEGWC